jgi:membrane associated rhomboid family serine protease
VNAVVLFDTLLFPWRIIYVNFILPVPALLLGAAVLSRDAYGAWGGDGRGGGGVAHAGHVGGAAVGAAAYAAFKLRLGRW